MLVAKMATAKTNRKKIERNAGIRDSGCKISFDTKHTIASESGHWQGKIRIKIEEQYTTVLVYVFKR